MIDSRALKLEECFRDQLRPPPKERAWEWCERSIYLDPKVSPVAPGWYDTRNAPAVRGLFDLAQDGEKRFIALKKCAQGGLTLWGYLVIAWAEVNSPRPAGISLPSVDQCRKKSEKTFQPIIVHSPVLAAHMPKDPDKFKHLQYGMQNMTIDWMGATKASQLSSETYGILLIDEPDKYPIVIANESTPLMLLMERTATIWNHLVMMTCTPTTERGLIHTEYLKGDQRKYHVPCVHCGTWQIIEWKNFKFDAKQLAEAAAASAYIKCISCKGKITSQQKNDMLVHGIWRPTATPETVDRASVHYPRWLCKWESASIYSIVRQFMQVRHKPNELRGFINSTLAEEFIVERIELGDSELKARKHKYKWGQIPIDTEWGIRWFGVDEDETIEVRTVVTVDVQKAHFWVCSRQCDAKGNSALIEFFAAFTWEEIDEYATRIGAYIVVIDAAYGERTSEVYEACLRYEFIPCMGRTRQQNGMVWNQSIINPFEGTRRQSHGISLPLVLYESDALRGQLMDRMNGYRVDEDKKKHVCKFGWAIPEDSPQGSGNYIDQVTSEEFNPESGAWEIKPGRSGNHAFDCEVMQILAAEMMGWNSHIAS